METLDSLRAQMRQTDEAMQDLFIQRCRLARRIGAYKQQHGLAVFDPTREEENRRVLAGAVDAEWRSYYMEFLQTVMDLAKRVQHDG